MSTDPLSPVAPARVRVLLLPVGRIKRSRFLLFAGRLRQEQIVRLGDISPDVSTSGKNVFSPLAFPDGAIFYHMALSPPSSSVDLAPLELFRQPLVVLCLADGLENRGDHVASIDGRPATHPDGGLGSEVSRIRGRHSALVTQLIMCDCTDTSQAWLPDDTLFLPPLDPTKSTSTAVKTAMCDVSGRLLLAMSIYATTIKSRTTVVIPAIVQLSVPSMLDRTPDHEVAPMSPDTERSRRSSSSRRPDYAIRSVSPSSAADSRPNSPPLRPAQIVRPIMPMTKTKSNVWTRGSKQDSTPRERGRRSSRSLFPSSSEASAVERERNIGKMRIGIVIGNMNLLTGRWPDAWRDLLEHTAQARALSDWLWHAKGLESILVCMLLFSWAGYDYAIPTMVTAMSDKRTNVSLADMAKDLLTALGPKHDANKAQTSSKLGRVLQDVITTILMYYERAAASTDDYLPAAAQAEMVIRMSKLAAHVAGSGGVLEAELLEQLVMGTTSNVYRSRLSAATHIIKPAYVDIVAELFKACPGSHVNLELAARVSIHAGIASVLSLLGMERKRAVILKEMITCLIPALFQARKLGAAEIGMHPSASISLTSGSFGADGASTDDVAVQELLHELRGIYGISTIASTADVVGLQLETSETALVQLMNDIARSAGTHVEATVKCGLGLKLDYLRACIEFCEALPDLAGMIHWSAILMQTVGPTRPLDVNGSSAVQLSTEEQIRHVSNISRAASAAAKYDPMPIEAPYWDEFLVRGIELYDDPQKNNLIQQSTGHSTRRPLDDTAGKRIAENATLVKGELATLIVTLQNPYDVEINIENLSFVTSGGNLSVRQEAYVLGTTRLQRVHCQVMATSPGSTKIHGCVVKVANCTARVFPVYPGLQASNDTKPIVRARHADQAGQDARTPTSTVLTLHVVPPQPVLALQSNSLVSSAEQGSALMLLEGQTKTFELVLSNTSSADVGYLHMSSEDDQTSFLQRRMAAARNGNAVDMKMQIREFETYLSDSHSCIEWKRTPCSTDKTATSDEQDSRSGIMAGRTATFQIFIRGSRHLSRVRICFDYAADDSERAMHVRRLAIPIRVSVRPAIEIRHVAVRPSPMSTSFRPDDDTQGQILEVLGTTASDENTARNNALLQLDLYNAWTKPLLATLTAHSSSTHNDSSTVDDRTEASLEWYTARKLVLPGSTTRLLLSVPKVYIDRPWARVLSLLASRQSQQYVVEALNVPLEIERASRNKFWTREALLTLLGAEWSEHEHELVAMTSNSGIVVTGQGESQDQVRRGRIDMRTLRFSDEDVQRLQLGAVQIDMTIVSDEQRHTNHICVESNAILRTRLLNRSDVTIWGILRLQPRMAGSVGSSADMSVDASADANLLSRNLLWSGQRQHRVRPLKPHEAISVDLTFCILSAGRYEIGALFEECRIPGGGAGGAGHVKVSRAEQTDDLVVGDVVEVHDRRRMWTTESCLINVS